MKLDIRNTPGLSVLLEAALCAWEHILDNHKTALWKEWLEKIGYSAMRHCSMQAGEIALAVFELMESKGFEHHDAYDWEFVPDVLHLLDWDKLVEHNQYGGPAYEPDLETILATMMANRPDSFVDTWIEEARREAKKQWCYEDLVSDHDDKIDRTETPAEWVKRIGEKYDLTPAGEW